jgi:uncharacterized repeat protein (TIGR01451 family)
MVRSGWGLIVLLLGLLCPVWSGAVPAGEKKGLELTIVSEKEIEVVNERGEKELQRVPPAQVVPGEEVIYTIRYHNHGPAPADGVVITNPIPEHLLYTTGSAGGAAARAGYSVDGGRNFGPPEELKMTMPDGRVRPATAADYTHIRWLLQKPVPPGGGGEVGYRARVR